jgi:type IV secretion system protein VirD4
VSDALGTATELRAMKNYAGHRLSPWLGHLMVSRQETARPLLTPGEVMQLPPHEELVLVSGAPPVRARKVRYFDDPELKHRIGEATPPACGPPPADDWSGLAPVPAPAPERSAPSADEGQGGLRLEPDTLFEDAAAEPQAPAPEFPFLFDDDEAPRDRSEAAAETLQRQFRKAARQASLDPDDGLEL